MIDRDAERAMEQILLESFAECLEQTGLVAAAPRLVDESELLDEGRLVVLTVAGVSFRLLSYLVAPSDGGLASGSAQDEDDFLCELGNVFCGAIKRRMVRVFPYLGVSTPNMLCGEHRAHLSALREGLFKLAASASVDAGYRLRAGLLVDAYQPLSLQPADVSDAAVNHGALELF